jgi:hypothetical protein
VVWLKQNKQINLLESAEIGCYIHEARSGAILAEASMFLDALHGRESYRSQT